jgi:uncharacterized membrane protein YphA (DoxX/SURF4 family)
MADPGYPALGTQAVGLLVAASGASLLIGFLTPFATVLTGLAGASVALSWLPAPTLNLFEPRLSMIFVVVMAAAIMLLGPGAFSLDSRLFGRREIIISHPSRSPRD